MRTTHSSFVTAGVINTIKPTQSMNNAVAVVDNIIADVRARTQADVLNEPWDEGGGGAGWLDNELSMVSDRFVSTQFDVSNCHSVEAVRNVMLEWPLDYLCLVEFVVVTMGGSSSEQVWQWAERTRSFVK